MSAFKFSVSRLSGLSKSPEPVSEQLEEVVEPTRAPYPKPKQSIELTRNGSYEVTRLPSLPHIFTSDPDSVRYSYTDAFTKHAVAVTDDMVYIWRYNSNDNIPVTINFPISVGENDELPKVVLVSPLPDFQDPGLLIIDTNTGMVRYYETILNAPAAGILHSNRVLELNLKLKGEHVRSAQFIPNSGVFIATSTQRVILLTLTDRTGKSSLNSTDVLLSNKSLLSGLFFNSNGNNKGDSYSNHVVAIREGHFFSHGIQQIIIQESDGNLSIVEFGLVSGVSIAFQQNVKDLLFQHVSNNDNFLNLSNFQVLDIQPVARFSNSFIILAAVDSSLLLYLLEIDHNGVLIKTANRIRNHRYTNEGLHKLFVPPEFDTTAFILSSNTLILTNAAVDESSKSQIWEEYISIKPNVQILGVGSEVNENAVNIVTRESGVLKAEMLPNVSKTSDLNTITLVDSFSFIKSRIEQAILFDDLDVPYHTETTEEDDIKMETSLVEPEHRQENPLQFDLNPQENRFSPTDVESAISSVISELLNNKSSCITPVDLSVTKHLKRRCKFMSRLINFVSKNFGDVLSEDFKAQILTHASKLNLSLQFYVSIDQSASALKKVEHDIVNGLKIYSTPGVSSVVHEFFLNHNDVIIDLLSIYFKTFVATEDLDTTCAIALKTFKSGFLDVEREIKEKLNLGDVSASSSYLLATKGICAGINNLLAEFTVRNKQYLDDIETGKYHDIAAGLSLFVYYTTCSTLAYYQSTENSDAFKKYMLFFNNYRYNLILIFTVLKQQDIILDYAVFFDDYQSICEILESERAPLVSLLESDAELNVIERLGLESRLEKVNELFNQYFAQFGYPFAETLYHFYINEGQIKLVLFGFKNFNHHLEKFFQQNTQYSYFSWLRPLLVQNYESTALILLNSFKMDKNLNYDNKKLQLSIAKLSLIALKSRIQNANELDEVDEMLYDISARNALIDLERDIHENLIAAFTELKDSNIEKMIHESKVFKLGGVSSTKFQLLKMELQKLDHREILPIVEIIDILTLVDFNKFSNIENFYDGFKLIAMFMNSKTLNDKSPKLLDFLQITLWRRLLLSTNWDELIGKFTNDSTEQELLLFLESSPIFKCLNKLIESQFIDLEDPNNSLIKLPDFRNFTGASPICNIVEADWKLIRSSTEFSELFDTGDNKFVNGYIIDIKEEENSLKTLINSKDLGKWIQRLLDSI